FIAGEALSAPDEASLDHANRDRAILPKPAINGRAWLVSAEAFARVVGRPDLGQRPSASHTNRAIDFSGNLSCLIQPARIAAAVAVHPRQDDHLCPHHVGAPCANRSEEHTSEL